MTYPFYCGAASMPGERLMPPNYQEWNVTELLSTACSYIQLIWSQAWLLLQR